MFNQDLLTSFLTQFEDSKHEKMLEVFIMSYEQHTKACAEALNARDADQLRLNVHDLKGLSYTLAAEEAGVQAGIIEENLVNEQSETAFEKTPKLLEELELVLGVMKERATKLN